MQFKSLVLGAAVALHATAAAAENPKPRIYFPRHVKRQFTNTTTTSEETFPAPESTPFTSQSESRNFITSLRSTVSDLLSRDSSTSTEERRDEGTVTTVIIQTTVRVSPTVETTSPESSDETTQETSERIASTESEDDETETETTSTRTRTTATTAAEDTVSSGIVIGPTGVVTSSSSTSTSTLTTERDISSADSSNSTESVTDLPVTTTTTRGILDPLTSLIGDILPSLPANETETAETTTTDLPEPTTTTTDGLPDITDILSSLTAAPTTLFPTVSANSTTESDLPPTETSNPPVETSTPPTETSTSSDELTLTSVPPTVTSLPPDPSGEPIPSNVTTTDLFPSTSAEPSQLPSPVPSQSDIGNGTSGVPEPSTPPTDLPVTSSVPSNNSDLSNEPTSTLPPVVPSASASDLPSDTTLTLSTSLDATVTVPTESWMPSTIIIPTGAPTSPGTTATTPVPIPSGLPGVISPEDVDDEQPEGTILLQVGFLYAENYEHVSEHPMAAAQIFKYLPVALGDGAEISRDRVKVVRLVPFYTQASLGYITTLARFYYPESMVDKLRMDIKIANSLLYNHPQELVFNLTQQINPAIDIIPGQESVAGAPGGGDSSDSPNGNNDILSNNETESTPIQKGTAAAIGIGAVGIAAAYGAAMFLVARRYKQKKQGHRRSSSIANSSEMRYNGAGSPAMMGGALLSRDFTGYGGIAGGRDSHGSGRSGAGNSVRTAQISAPVAAENSLGWN